MKGNSKRTFIAACALALCASAPPERALAQARETPAAAQGRPAPKPTPWVSYSKSDPSFSPDGRQVVFEEMEMTDAKATGYRLKVVNTDGTGERVVASGDGNFSQPRFSRDGGLLVFTAFRKVAGGKGRQSDVWVVGTDGSGLRQLTNTPEGEWGADFTWDGTAVLFLRSRKEGEAWRDPMALRLSLADGKERPLLREDFPVKLVTPAAGGGVYVTCQCKLEGGKLVWESLYGVFYVGPDGALGKPMVENSLQSVLGLRVARSAARVGMLLEERTFGNIMEPVAGLASGPKKELRVVGGGLNVKVLDDASRFFGFDLSADGKQLILAGRMTDGQPSALWLYDIDTKKWSPIRSPEEVAREKAALAARQHLERGLAHGHAKRFDEAIAEFNEALKYVPDGALIFRNRAIIHSFKGDLISALKDYAEVIRLAPNAPDGYAERGVLLAQANRLEESAADFTEAIKRAPASRNLYVARAQVYRRLGKLDLAGTDEQKARELAHPHK